MRTTKFRLTAETNVTADPVILTGASTLAGLARRLRGNADQWTTLDAITLEDTSLAPGTWTDTLFEHLRAIWLRGDIDGIVFNILRHHCQ